MFSFINYPAAPSLFEQNREANIKANGAKPPAVQKTDAVSGQQLTAIAAPSTQMAIGAKQLLTGVKQAVLGAKDVVVGATREMEGVVNSAFKFVKPKIKRSLASAATAMTGATAAPKKMTDPLEIQKEAILNENPAWRAAVRNWTGVSLADEVWMLQLCELNKISALPRLGHEWILCKDPIVPAYRVHPLLKLKAEINEAINNVHILLVTDNLTKIPDAIGMLVNLEHLIVIDSPLQVAPNISRNTKLKSLYITGTQITKGPDMSKNVLLSDCNLKGNKITTPPDSSHNPLLKQIDLSGNPLGTSSK